MSAEERIRRNKLRRKRELRHHIMIFASVTALIIIAVSITAGSISSKAQDQDSETYYKYYTSIEIQSGDTLWSLAGTHADDRFMSRQEFINEVTRTNHLLSSDIQQGDHLIIPYYSVEFKQ